MSKRNRKIKRAKEKSKNATRNTQKHESKCQKTKNSSLKFEICKKNNVKKPFNR